MANLSIEMLHLYLQYSVVAAVYLTLLHEC
jgi:hypothetical protein